MLWFVITFGILVYVVSRVLKVMNHWENRNIPYIKPLPVLGNSAPLLFRKRSFVDHIQTLYNTFPDKRFYGVFQFMKPQILIRDPELIKQITVKDFEYFTDRTELITEDIEPYFSKNLAWLKGQAWRDMRVTLSPIFTSSKMKFMFTLISDCAKQFSTYFQNETNNGIIDVEVKDAFGRFTNDAIASAAFGVTVNSFKHKQNEFFRIGKDLTTMGGFIIVKFFGASTYLSVMRFLKVSIFSVASTNLLRRVVGETIKIREETGVVRPDMIHILLEAKKGRLRHEEEDHVDEGFAATKEILPTERDQKHQKTQTIEDVIVAQAMIFYLGGFESSSTLLTFLAYELAVYPDVQAKLQNEIDKTMRKFNGELNYDAVLGMKYLDMVVSEALRKWTPGIRLDRLCIKDYEIPATQPGEKTFIVEKGTIIIVPLIALHLDPEYFPNPYKFDPERFNDENKNYIIPYTYMPFGSGPRNCIASRFALMEIKLVLCHILTIFHIVPTSKTLIPLVLGKKNLSLIPDGGMWLGFKQRKVSDT